MTPEQRGQKRRLNAALLSLFAGLLILALKAYAFHITQSPTLLSDALEGLVNVAAASMAIFAIIVAAKPADELHPFGHGKIEYFSAIFEGVLLTVTSVTIGYKAILALFQPHPIEHLGLGLMIDTGAGFLNGLLGWYMLHVGKKEKSKTLQASGHHILSDFYTTLGLLVGLSIVHFTGHTWLDPVLALGMALWILRTGFLIARDAGDALLDGQDLVSIRKIVELFNKNRRNEIIMLHDLRVMRSGRNRNVSVHVIVPEYFEVLRAHDAVSAYATEIKKRAAMKGEFMTHVDPCLRNYCENCAMADCPVRERPFVSLRELDFQAAIEDEVPHAPTH